MAEIIEGTFIKVPDESWRERLTTARDQLVKRTVPAFIEFCREVHAFRLDCDGTQGGSLFSKLGCEWLGVTHSMLVRWDAVGRRSGELVSALTSLPASEDAIAQIAMLDDIAFPKALEHIKPDMTQKDVRELVKDLNPRPEPTPEDQESAVIRKRDRLYRDFQALPDRHRFILGDLILDDLKHLGWEP